MHTSRHTLLLTRSEVADLATTADYLECMRSAFARWAAQSYLLPDVGHVPGRGGAFHIKAASHMDASPKAAVKINGNFPGNAAHGAPTIQGFIALFDAANGSLLALMDSIEVTARRTAAATALAAEYLARRDSHVLAIIGCGVQATYHVAAARDVLPIREVRCFDLRSEVAETFKQRAEAAGLQAVCTTSASEAARSADVVVTLTTSTQPILDLEDVRPGTFVAGVGADNPSKHELAPGLLAASRVVADLLAQAAHMGDLHHAIAAGAMSASDIHGELADIVAGKRVGRSNDAERFVFDSTGVAFQDLAAAEMIYAAACARDDYSSS